MSTFSISRPKQFLLLMDGCSCYNVQSRDQRLQIARLIREMHPELIFDPNQTGSYDLSLLLEILSDDEHDAVFDAFLNA